MEELSALGKAIPVIAVGIILAAFFVPQACGFCGNTSGELFFRLGKLMGPRGRG